MAKDLASTPDDSSGLGGTYLQQAYALKDVHEAVNLYDKWAEAYDDDLNSMNYASPQRAVDTVLSTLKPTSDKVRILDAGCGTGLVGLCFAKSSLSGNFVIDGVDVSEGMLATAREKKVYQSLDRVDLTKPLQRQDASYDVITCVGTLTKGHVGPQVFDEFCRVAADGGIIVATVHNEIWTSGGYEAKVEALNADHVAELISADEFGITVGLTTGGRMVVMRKTKKD